MSCRRCGQSDPCACGRSASGDRLSVLIDCDPRDHSEETFAASIESAGENHGAQDFYRPSGMSAAETTPAEEEDWKDEVARRLEAHRARRKRRNGGNSLALDFGPAPEVSAPSPESLRREELIARLQAKSLRIEPLPNGIQAEPKPVPVPMERSRARKVIAFPRPTPVTEELAEPLFADLPRIVEATENAELLHEMSAPSAMADIRFDQTSPDGIASRSAFLSDLELPLQGAPLGQRCFAGAVDSILVLAASAMFAMIFLQMSREVPASRLAMPFGFAVPTVLWAVYQYLFLVYGHATAGMQMARLSLRTFDGELPTVAQRKLRVLSVVLSGVSAGLGFLWAIVDQDRLGWHDRITRTYVVQE